MTVGAQAMRVLRLIAEGHTEKTAADQLGISYFTVRAHVRTIRAELQARSAAHMVHRAWQEGLLP